MIGPTSDFSSLMLMSDGGALTIGKEVPEMNRAEQVALFERIGAHVNAKTATGRNLFLVVDEKEVMIPRAKVYVACEPNEVGEAIEKIAEYIGPGRVWFSSENPVTYLTRSNGELNTVSTRRAIKPDTVNLPDGGCQFDEESPPMVIVGSYYLHEKNGRPA